MLRKKTNRLKFFSGQVGIPIKASKTKIMDFTNSLDKINLNGEEIEKVSKFTYLGSKLYLDRDVI
jgi:hypothetical protein